MATLAPSASDRDGSSSQIRMRIASTSVAGERPYGAPAPEASVRRRIQSEYAGTAASGDGARLGGGGGRAPPRPCAGAAPRRGRAPAAGRPRGRGGPPPPPPPP